MLSRTGKLGNITLKPEVIKKAVYVICKRKTKSQYLQTEILIGDVCSFSFCLNDNELGSCLQLG